MESRRKPPIPQPDDDLAELQREIDALDRKGDVTTLDETDEAISNTLALEERLSHSLDGNSEVVLDEADVVTPIYSPVWEPIFDAPRDGHAVTVRFEDPDIEPRWARWKQSRKFLHSRWVQGGSWINADSFQPLPAEPTEYLKLPEAEPVAIPEGGA